MSDVPDKSQRMNTESAKFDGAANRLRAMTKREGAMARLRIDMAKRNDAVKRFQTNKVKRKPVNSRWMIGAITGATVIILAGVTLIIGR